MIAENGNNSIKLTVIIPVYNKGQFLRDTVKSVIDQAYEAVEIILINDGSTDNSGIICDELSKSYPFINVIHQENRGVSAARNKGMSEAKGLYILFVDADDLLPPNTIIQLMEVVEKDEIDVLMFNYSILQDSCCININDLITLDESVIVQPTNNCEVLFLRLLFQNIINNIGTKIYRTSIIRGLRFIPYSICEDISFCIDAICSANTIGYINKCLYIYRYNVDDSLMANYKKNYFDAACCLLKKMESLRIHLNSSKGANQQYLKYKDTICKNILVNESKVGLKRFMQVCSQISASVYFRELIVSKEGMGIKNFFYYFFLENNLSVFLFIYYRLCFFKS